MRTLFLFLTAAVWANAQDTSTLDTHVAAGKAAISQSNYAAAAKELRLAVDAISSLDSRNAATLGHSVDALEELSSLDVLMGNYKEAVSLEERAVASLEASGSKDSPDMVPHLASAYRAAGRADQAVPVLERVLKLDVPANAAANHDVMGATYLSLNRFEDARTAYRLALETRIATLGADHIEVASSYVNLGIVEERAGKPNFARPQYERALAVSEKRLGPENYALTGILDRLGLLHRNLREYAEAEPILQRSLAIREKHLGQRHSEVAPALDNLGLTYFFDKKYAEAEPLFTRSMQIYVMTQGPFSPFVAQSLDNLGALYAAQDRYDEAEPMYKGALSIREKQDIESLGNLALVYAAKKDIKRADEYFQRAILIGEKGLGGDHPEVADVMENYAVFLKASNRPQDARKLDLRAKDQRDHPHRDR